MRQLNFCEKCFEKQRKIDELNEELQRLRGQLNRKERKEKEGPFGSSTPSSQKPFKPNTPEEEKKMGGARPGHKGYGRKGFTSEEADRIEDVVGRGENGPRSSDEMSRWFDSFDS